MTVVIAVPSSLDDLTFESVLDQLAQHPADAKVIVIGTDVADHLFNGLDPLGREVRIEPQLMDLLVLFATSDGRVLAKDEIIASVWSGRAVGDDTLAAAISRLRAALGATPARRYIETVPKRGYRLATPLDGPDATPPKAVAPPEDSEATRLVAQGLAMLRTGAPMALPQARLYFEAAIGADPRLAEAQAGLAETLS